MKYYTIKSILESKITYFQIVPDCVGYPFDVRRVYPTRQRVVCGIYDLLTNNTLVEKLWLFGSCSNASCMPYSDIDLAILLKRNTPEEWRRVCRMIRETFPEYEYDFINIANVDKYSTLKINIVKGVKII